MAIVTDKETIDKLNSLRQTTSSNQVVSSVFVTDSDLKGKLDKKLAETKVGNPLDAPAEATEEPVPSALGTYAANVQARLGKTRKDVEDTLNLPPELSPLAPVQLLGKGVIGGVYEIMGETFNLGLKGISYVVPDFIEDPIKQNVAEGFNYAITTPAGAAALEALETGQDAWTEFKYKNPEAAKTIESVVNIATFFAPIKKSAVPTIKTPTMAEKVSNIAFETAEKQIESQSKKKAVSLVMPTKVNPETVTEKSVLGYKFSVPTPTPSESEIIEAVSKLKIPTSASYIKSRDLIKAGIEKEAKSLESSLGRSNIKVPLAESSKAINNAIAASKVNDPFVNANTLGRLLDDVADKAKTILAKNDETPLGILKSRRELDDWIKQYKKPGSQVFLSQDKVETALDIAVRDVRTSLNDLLETKVPSVAVKKSLSQQSNLYRVNPVVLEKITQDASSTAGRLWQNITKTTGIKMVSTPLAGAATVAAFAGYLPAVVGTAAVGFGGYAAGRALISPKTKVFLGKTILAADKAIKTATDKEMLKQLRADRAALIEILKTAEVSDVVTEDIE